jgi:transcriptional regulator NrdR family protein
MYQFMKKDGTLEDFDRNKIVAGAVKSGAAAEEAEKVAASIEAWLPTAAANNVVKSQDVRTKALEVLGTVNPAAVASFAVYQKPA